MKRTGRVLRESRAHAGVSLRSLATLIGVNPSTLCRVEADRERASDRIVEGYVVALKLDRDETYRAVGRVPPEIVATLLATPGVFARIRAGLDESEESVEPHTEVDRDIAAIESALDCEGLRDEERETFEALVDMLTSGKLERLTGRQRSRLERVRRRVGDLGDEPANLWSKLSPEEQNRQRDDARRVVLPWEREQFETPDKLPQR